MDSIDVLGPHPERREAFSPELLAETEDRQLQQIVERAAKELSTPIALVSLVLDHVQFFKAHVGLPPDLAAARGTHRDVSFCQFVVRDAEPFEVTDGAKDDRIPQHFVEEYDISAYLGFPIQVGDVVIGSLCVLDTKSRKFTENQRTALQQLATLVNKRVGELNEQRRLVRLKLSENALTPALAELGDCLKSIRAGVATGLSANVAIETFLCLCRHMSEGGTVSPKALRSGLDAATDALQEQEDSLHQVAAAIEDSADCVNALDLLAADRRATTLSEVAIAAQDLARYATKSVGGAPLPDFGQDPALYVSRALAVGVLTTCLISVAERLASVDSADGIELRPSYREGAATLSISSVGLPGKAVAEIADGLRDQTKEDPTLDVTSINDAVCLTFKVERTGIANEET